MSHGITSRSGNTGARGLIFGPVSNGSSWHEDLEITRDGSAVSDAQDWEWQLKLRVNYDESPDLALSTTDGTLTISQGAAATTVEIRVPYTSMSALEGDYIIDLASKDDDDRVIHWGHGMVTFRNEPVWSD
jgi:hypothetical protein